MLGRRIWIQLRREREIVGRVSPYLGRIGFFFLVEAAFFSTIQVVQFFIFFLPIRNLLLESSSAISASREDSLLAKILGYLSPDIISPLSLEKKIYIDLTRNSQLPSRKTQLGRRDPDSVDAQTEEPKKRQRKNDGTANQRRKTYE